jgi:hypothetical protein
VVASVLTVLFSAIAVPWLYTNKKDTGYLFKSGTDVFALCGIYFLPFCAWMGLGMHALVGGFNTVEVSGVITEINGSVVRLDGVDKPLRYSEDYAFAQVGDHIYAECYQGTEEFDLCTEP